MADRIRRRRPSPALVMSCLALVVSAAGGTFAAVAAIPDAGGTIHGCYAKLGGQLRVIDTAKDQKCNVLEKAVNWNQGFAKPTTYTVTEFHSTGLGSASCDDGDLAVGGGYDGTGPIAISAPSYQGEPVVADHGPSPDGWFIEVNGNVPHNPNFYVWVACMHV